MKHIFYILAIFPIMWELYSLSNATKVRNLLERLKIKATSDYTINEKLFSVFALGYIMWTVGNETIFRVSRKIWI